MKKYIINVFYKAGYGMFYCIEQYRPDTKETFLIGKFENKGAQYTFIKHPNDKEI